MRHFIFILALIFFTGCVTKQSTFSLSDEKKLQIYLDVIYEIEYYKNKANMALQNQQYKVAIDSYEKVNFFEHKQLYKEQFLQRLNKKATLLGKSFYAKAISKNETNQIKSLYYLNYMMMNKPYADGYEMFKEIKKENNIKAFIEEKENKLKLQLDNFDNKSSSMAVLKNYLDALKAYDFENNLLIKAEKILKKSYLEQIKKAAALYRMKKYEESKIIFSGLNDIYPKNKIINRYLNLINLNNEIKRAKVLLNLKKYKEANAIAKKILKIYPNNIQANMIKEKSKHVEVLNVKPLIKEAIKFYNKQNFKKAKIFFNKVLNVDSKNSTAKTYLKKINQQLKTIKSLQ